MSYATDGASPKNMGTQCENTNVENQNTVRTSGLRKYFGLGVHTSDPLLNVVKWIAYFTEVSCFHVRDVIFFYTDWCNCHCGRPLFPSSAFSSVVVLFQLWCWFIRHLCILVLDWCVVGWTAGLLLHPLYVGQTIKTPTSWHPTGGHLSNTLNEKFLKQPIKIWPLLTLTPTQLSAVKFLPWTLTVFIHSLPPAYLYFCFIRKRTNALLPWPLSGELGWSGAGSPLPEVIYRKDPTYCHWVIVWSLILTPQFVVLVALAAVIRVRRFDPNLNSVKFYQPTDLNDASASGWTMKEKEAS